MGFHVVKRDNVSPLTKVGLYVIAIVTALFLGACVLWSMDVDPFEYYYQMFTMGTVGNRIAYKTFMNYIKEFVPLVLTAVALSLTFKMKFWNIGGEGQFIMGAIASGFVALQYGTKKPMAITLLLMCDATMITAGLYGLLAGF